jgi:penicillin-binding protein 2
MEFRGPSVLEEWRVIVLALAMVGALSVLTMRLYHVQIVRSADYEGRQRRQSVRRVLLPSPRGRILDRHGVCLADNQPNYCLGVFVEELRRAGSWNQTVDAVDDELTRLSVQLGLPRTCDRPTIVRHVQRRLALPLLAWEHLDERQLARFSESLDPFPGVDIHVQPERRYPLGSLAAHVLGYVGRERPDTDDEDEVFHYVLMGMTGRSGLEKQYDEKLEGESGGQLILVDAAGYKRGLLGGRAARPGQDLTVTLDAQLQSVIEQGLQGQRGAGVVLDSRNGDVLALVSAPAFDLNAFSPAPSAAVWERLSTDPARPLYNRAVQGRYAPGSTFKPVVALGALTDARFDPVESYGCTGTYDLKPRPIHCAHGAVHGAVDLRRAIEVSCNGYFCHLGARLGYAPVRSMAAAMGFGERTGIDLPSETAGLLPDESWKKKNYGDGWRMGDTCLICIGQGALLVSPLQMAVATAAIANGGRVLRPRLVHADDTGETVRTVVWRPEALERVRAGMADVVQTGTGRRAGGTGVTAAGKTGTAEYVAGGRIRKHAWMIAYAPVEAPTVVMAIMVEDAESGGVTVAPLVKAVLVAMFGSDEAAAAAEVPAA